MNAKEQNLSTPEIKYVVKKSDPLAIALSITLLICGVVICIIHDQMIGAILIMISLLFFILKHKKTIYLKTNSRVKSFTYFMDSENLAKLEENILVADLSKEEPITFCRSRDARMELVISDDKRYIAVQLFITEDSKWIEHTSVKYFFDDDAKRLITYLDNCKFE